MKSRITSLGLPAALLSASLFAACQNTARGVEADTEKNTAAAKEESREAADASKNTMERAGDATKDAAEKVAAEAREAGREIAGETKEAARDAQREGKEAAGTAGRAIDAAQQTLQIKTALIDADDIDAAGIDVDTNGTTKTVTLKGHVPTAAQKAAAERVARSKAPDYRIVNELVVRS
jgi:osmotically-inducible protein OsmY